MMRQKFMPIAVREHHQMIATVLSVHLRSARRSVARDPQANAFTLDADCIQSIKRESRDRSARIPGYFAIKGVGLVVSMHAQA